MQKLTMKQQQFADYYIISGNASEAAIQAGYSKKMAEKKAYLMLEHPLIREYIKNRMKSHESKMIADQDEVLMFLTRTMRGEIEDFEDTELGRMNMQFTKDRVKAAELLGKRYMLFTDKVDINATVAPVTIVDDIPDE